MNYVPFPDFGQGSSYQQTLGASVYNGLQTKFEQRLNHGLYYLLTYTYSKTMTDAVDLLNGGSTGGLSSGNYRAPYVPGLGPNFDWSLATFDVRNVAHLSGGYELPFGKGKAYLSNGSRLAQSAIGGWSVNALATLQGGQPLTIPCPSATTTGTGCGSFRVPGQDPKLGIQERLINGKPTPFWLNNPAAFQQPCQLGANGSPISNSPTGCVLRTGIGVLGGPPSVTYGPGFHRLDFSLFKNFQFTERYSLQFRSEFFNILNHPNFNAPGFGGNGVVAIGNSLNFNSSTFGQIGSTRDAPYDPRQIQFALKLYY